MGSARTKGRWGMGLILRLAGTALARGHGAQEAHAQDTGAPPVLPTIDVGVTRIGSAGMTGTSTSVISSEEIARSPRQTLSVFLCVLVGVLFLFFGVGVFGV